MKTVYVKTRSELTGKMREYLKQGFDCYRVRVSCGCKTINPERNMTANQRNGLIVLSDVLLIEKIIRCKACTSKLTMI
jgi:hypothetical protein